MTTKIKINSKDEIDYIPTFEEVNDGEFFVTYKHRQLMMRIDNNYVYNFDNRKVHDLDAGEPIKKVNFVEINWSFEEPKKA